jgi:putative transposase
MIFETGNLYHIYNQGNNRQKIFIKDENYLYFLNKIKKHILPHADILGWCLMPNHFHLMVYVHTVEIYVNTGGATLSRTPINQENIGGATHSRTPSTQGTNINKSIGILLASYTRAINIQEKRTGSLFRDKAKAECLSKFQGITPSFFGTQINVRIPEKEYPIVCWNYIHNNPVTAKIVDRAEDYVYSSYRDFIGLRDGKLINKNRAKEFGLI